MLFDPSRSPALHDDWGLNALSRLPPTKSYKAIFVSDLHLPRGDANPKYLYEFLLHNECDTLYLLGDSHEGYDPQLKDFSEMALRVWDLIAARKAQGMRVVDVPGNHDSYKRRDTILAHKVFGHEYWNNLVVDSADGPTFVFHGDSLDGKLVKRYDKVAYKIAAKIAIGKRSLLDVHSAIEKLSDSLFGGKEKKTNCLDVEFAAASLAEQHGCNAVLMGHTHKPASFAPASEKPDVLYGNTGAWVGGICTAMALNHDGTWELLRWNEERRSLYSKKPKGEDAPNLFKSFRDSTLAEFQWQKAQHSLFAQEAIVFQTREMVENMERIKNRVVKFLRKAEAELEQTYEEITQINRFANIERLDTPDSAVALPPAPAPAQS